MIKFVVVTLLAGTLMLCGSATFQVPPGTDGELLIDPHSHRPTPRSHLPPHSIPNSDHSDEPLILTQGNKRGYCPDQFSQEIDTKLEKHQRYRLDTDCPELKRCCQVYEYHFKGFMDVFVYTWSQVRFPLPDKNGVISDVNIISGGGIYKVREAGLATHSPALHLHLRQPKPIPGQDDQICGSDTVGWYSHGKTIMVVQGAMATPQYNDGMDGMPAALPRPPPYPIMKRGVCPNSYLVPIESDTTGFTSMQQCKYDSDCPGSMKCCPNRKYYESPRPDESPRPYEMERNIGQRRIPVFTKFCQDPVYYKPGYQRG
ncbi:hypothetical protein Pmani_031460 [Petrolisthes manimaculis]|uniref:WAP domain-containing protein n=1 Tax=Petrolisthes manimaculis TaxID=1843537 RepID=A0AAE1NUM6_9EUCA|nr:hypothetical protein Pmani_031460 [Petrolisthes manimaculis]